MNDIRPYSLELHSHNEDMVELTDYVKTMSWGEATTAPWGMAQIVLALHRHSWAEGGKGVKMPHLGDWLVIRNELTGSADWWGYITDVGTGIHYQAVRSEPVVIRAITYLGLMARTQVVLADGLENGGQGTMFTMAEWQAVMRSLLETATGNPGDALPGFWKSIARVQLPETLSGLYLGDAVRVVHDELSARNFAPGTTVDPPRGPSLQALRSLRPNRATVASLLMGTFAPDAMMIEIFPTLAPYGQILPGVFAGIDPLILEQTEGTVAARGEYRAQTTPATGLSRALAANAVLVYRIRPWRARTLSDFASKSGLEIDDGLFPGTTWNTADAVVIPREHIHYVPITLSDSDRVNAVTVGLPNQPDTPLRYWERAGLPISSDNQINLYGLRLFEPQWPFYPPIDIDEGDHSDLLEHMRTVAALGAQFALVGERFHRGVSVLKFRPDLKAGSIVSHEMPEGTPGDGYLVCYADAVQHTITVTDGKNGAPSKVNLKTRVTFSRGLLTEGQDGLVRAPREIREAPEKEDLGRKLTIDEGVPK